MRYAKLPHLYFYTEQEEADAAFGFVDIEISLQRLGGRYVVELYCAADGYQSGTGSGEGTPLQIEFLTKGSVVGTVAWPYPDVRSGTADPITFRSEIAISDADFEAIDAVVTASAAATCRIDLDD